MGIADIAVSVAVFLYLLYKIEKVEGRVEELETKLEELEAA